MDWLHARGVGRTACVACMVMEAHIGYVIKGRRPRAVFDTDHDEQVPHEAGATARDEKAHDLP